MTDANWTSVAPELVSSTSGILVISGLALLDLITVFGNSLVIVAVLRERFLRCSVTNYFVVSLAIADLLIGSVVMPFAISLEVTAQYWPYGGNWCDAWHSFDVLASTASILNLSVIALDRYWAITDPISYPTKMSTKRALILIISVWVCGSAISFPAILYWRYVEVNRLPNVCRFTDDATYLILSSLVSFYGPIVVILYAYRRIYIAASEQLRGLRDGSKTLRRSRTNGNKEEKITLRIHRGGVYRNHMPTASPCPGQSNTIKDKRRQLVRNNARSLLVTENLAATEGEVGVLVKSDIANKIPTIQTNCVKWRPCTISQRLRRLPKEQKAARTLGIVMGVFCVCWVPFFVTSVVAAICGATCIHNPELTFPVITWLGYANSAMNPVIYAYTMKDFRRAFGRVLTCCCPRWGNGRRRRARWLNTRDNGSVLLRHHAL